MQLYARIAWFNFSTYLQYPLEFLSAAVNPIVDLVLKLVLWGVIAASAPGTINFRHIIAYFLVATAISNGLLFNGLRFGGYLAKRIKYGEISRTMIKPVNVLHSLLAELLGNNGVVYGLSMSFMVVGLIIEPPQSLFSLGLFVIYMVLGLAISYAINLLIGTIAFYTTEAGSFKNVGTHIIRVFGGLLIPLNYFPNGLRQLALLLPFGTPIYGPTNALQTTKFSQEGVMSLMASFVWSVVLIVAATYVWRRGIRKYEAIGL